MLHFEWDPAKERRNRIKHGISFEEAQTAFADNHARMISDPDHSGEEDRFILLGMSQHLRILVVCHCYRRSGEMIRIFSARKATRQERKLYAEGLS